MASDLRRSRQKPSVTRTVHLSDTCDLAVADAQLAYEGRSLSWQLLIPPVPGNRRPLQSLRARYLFRRHGMFRHAPDRVVAVTCA